MKLDNGYYWMRETGNNVDTTKLVYVEDDCAYQLGDTDLWISEEQNEKYKSRGFNFIFEPVIIPMPTWKK